MTESRKLRVFLCHASQDKPIVRELYQRLLAEGWIDPWLDEENLLPGQDWDMEIEKAVEAAEAVIVSLSSSSVTKEGYVQKELRKVLDVADEKLDGAIFVIPVRINDVTIPRRLKIWQYVDYFPKENQDRVYKRILESLKIRAKFVGVENNQIITTPIGEDSKIIERENNQNKIKILLVNDQEIILLGLKTLLEKHPRFEVVGSVDSARKAIEEVEKSTPDMVVMNVQLQGMSGIEACQEITDRFPNTKVVVLTSQPEDELLFSAIRAGASGYILTQINIDDLILALLSMGESGALLGSKLPMEFLENIKRNKDK